MVPNDDHRSLRREVFAALNDDEAHAGRVAHDEVEGAGGGPLCETVLAHSSEGERGEDAIGCAGDEGDVGGEEAREEAEDRELRKEVGEGKEEHGHSDEEGAAEENVIEEEIHLE